MPESQMTGGRVLLLGALAAALHALADLLTFRSQWLRPPYLRLEDAPEAFASISPVTVSIAASAVSGVIALLAIAAVEPGPRRRVLALGLVLAGFWGFSALLTYTVWLDTRWSFAATSVALALPRGLAIGWVIARLSPGSPEAAPPPASPSR